MLAEVSVGQFLIPGFALMLVVALVLIVKVAVSRYKKIPPNKVGIIYGRGSTMTAEGRLQGCRVAQGGGVFVWPIFQNIEFMDTATFALQIKETSIPNKDNVKVSVSGVAVCKISNAPEDLQSAAMAFLGQKPEQIHLTILAVLIGHLRSIIGKLDIDKLLRDRDAFNSAVVNESTTELKKMGIELVSLVIQDVEDQEGYIDALGKRAVADAKRDANIKVAQAEAATRQQVSTALREASIIEAENAVAVADAQKNRDVKIALFKVEADGKKAEGDNALAIATAAQQQILRVAEAVRDAAEREAQIPVQQKEAERRQQELVATVIRPAEAEKEATIIRADGQKQAAILAADAAKQVAVLNATGQADAAKALGIGQAAQTLATLNARAEGEAAITKQALLAQAEGEAAKKGKVLLAEAEGTLKMAEALAAMTDSAKLILVLDRLGPLMASGGDALAKVAKGIFEPVAAGLSSIDKINITDLGGTGRGVDQIGGIVPKVIFDFISRMAASGVDLGALAKKAGLNIDGLLTMTGLAEKAPISETVPVGAAPSGANVDDQG